MTILTDGNCHEIPAAAFNSFHAYAGREGRWRIIRKGFEVSLRVGPLLYTIIGRRGDMLVLRMARRPGRVIGDYDYDAEIGLTDERVAASAVAELVEMLQFYDGGPVEAGIALDPPVLEPRPKPKRRDTGSGIAPAPMPRINGHLPAATLFPGETQVLAIVRRSFPRMASTFESISRWHERIAADRTVDDAIALLETVGTAPRSLVELRTANDRSVIHYAEALSRLAA